VKQAVSYVNALTVAGRLTAVYIRRMADDDVALVSPADIARLAGVTRAAVSNWRRRHADFPEPSSGTASAPLFSLAEVRSWLDERGKTREVSDEVELWHALRAEFGDDMTGALRAVAREMLNRRRSGMRPVLTDRIKLVASERPPAELIGDLAARLTASAGRKGSDFGASPTLVRVVRHFAGETTGTVYDPACGIGDLLLSVGGDEVAERIGQELNGDLAAFVADRAALQQPDTKVKIAPGDALRADRFPDLKADLVVCHPPSASTDWGREELLLDPRWEFGLPPKAEGELAWVQHCYSHTAPGGRAVVVVLAGVAFRRSGRRIRAELVRSGALETVVELPPRLVLSHNLRVHLWVLRRPAEAAPTSGSVHMIDLSELDLAGPIEPDPARTVSIPAINLLDEDVDLTPSRHITTPPPEYTAAYRDARQRLNVVIGDLARALPDLGETHEEEFAATFNLSDLIRAGLVDIEDGEPVSRTDQLDTDYLRGFLRSPANVRRNTSSSGTHRADPRGARIPQMPLERQREYAAAFRAVEKFLHDLDELAKMGRQAAELAMDGLTTGALNPPPPEQAGNTREDDA
jgi:N-6 DNA Methylase